MINIEILKIICFTFLVGILAYGVGRIAFATARIKITSLHIASSPIVGLLLLANQLWLYGLVGISWNRWLLLLPWALLSFMQRRQIMISFAAEKSLLKRARQSFKAMGYLTKLCVVLVVIFSSAYLVALVTEPFITSDILAIWGYKAKEFFINSAVYINPRLSDTVNSARFFHIDYPPLMPLIADAFYVIAGRVNEPIFKAMQIVFLASGGASLYLFARSVLGKKDRELAALFLLLFVAVPQFLPMLFQLKYMGYADFPLAVVCMLSVIFLLRGTRQVFSSDWYLALFFASCAAVMKNEGIAFLGIMLLILGGFSLVQTTGWTRENGWQKLTVRVLLAGAILLPNILWIVYKQQHNLVVDFKYGNLAASGVGLYERLHTVAAFMWLYIRTNPIFHWELVAIVIGTIGTLWYRTKLSLVVAAVLWLQLGSFVLSYVFSPYDLKFHILSSIDRLLTQILPVIILLLVVNIAATTKRLKD